MHCQISFAMRNTAGKRAVMLCEFKLEGLNVLSFIYWQFISYVFKNCGKVTGDGLGRVCEQTVIV
jgi:hypothetical protein